MAVGVQSTVKVRSGPQSAQRSPVSTWFIAALTERGLTGRCHSVRSMAEYELLFGARVSYGFGTDAAKTFFEEGGTLLKVVRVVGAAATTGTKTLLDQAGTPLATIKLDAKGQGAWSAGITVAVAAGTVSGTRMITLTYGGETEVYDNLDTVATAVRAINGRSKWVVATDLGSATTAPNNMPGTLAATALSAGTDDRASVAAADYVTALNTYATISEGGGAVSVPGQSSATVGAGLITHAITNKRTVLLAAATGTTTANAISAAQNLRGSLGSERAALIYPWVTIPDGSGGTRDIPPEAFAAGVRARAQEFIGPWVAPAGDIASARFVVALQTSIDATTGNQLDDAQVSAIRTLAGSIRMYGWRTLSSDDANWHFLNYADLMNYLEVAGDALLEKYVFDTIDAKGHLFSKLAGEMVGLVEPIRAGGGLYENIDPATQQQIDPGYSVSVGPSVNPISAIAQGQAAVAVAVRPSPTGALITLSLTKAALTAAV